MPTSTVKEVSGPFQFPARENRLRANLRRIGFALSVNLYLFLVFSAVQGQTTKVELAVTSLSPARIRIKAELPQSINTLSFRSTYAGILGLGERIENFRAMDTAGQVIEVSRQAAGQFQSAQKFSQIAYDVDVSVPAQPSQLSHLSSLESDRGVLMLADLLPQGLKSVRVSVVVPKNWRVIANVAKVGNEFFADDQETAIFLIGARIQEKKQRLASNTFSFITSDKWPFSSGDAIAEARRILEENSRITQHPLKRDVFLVLLPYPGDAGPDKWSAETRGNTVVLLLGKKGNQKRVLAKLGIVLSHELFHLWVPNSLQLQGDYDWFFEGFTLYQALRTDLRLGLITFNNYLATIGRVYDSYQAKAQLDRLSLIEASERRWTNSPSLVYEKGMLVAFLYDLGLRSGTNCSQSLEDVYADLFRLPATGQANANETIIRLLTAKNGMASFARDYIETPSRINLAASLTPYGIEIQQGTAGSTKLLVKPDLSQSQRMVLDCIGFRN